MFQTTRRRLGLWYTAITALLLLLFASGVYLYVRSTLIERIDDTLNHVVEVVARSLVIEPVKSNHATLRINVEASFRDNADSVEDDHIDLEWFSPNGKLLWSTFSEPLKIPVHPNRTGETVKIIRSTPHSPVLLLRQVTERVQAERQVLGYLRVSHPWFEVTKPSRQLIFDLALGISLMIISVGASGWFLSGIAMEPVRDSYQRLKQFTADASHELRSPITLIQTNVQVALADPELAAVQSTSAKEYRQHLLVVEKLTQRLARLVNDLLFLARQDSSETQANFSPCPLDALLMEVVAEQQLLATAKNIKISLNLVGPPITVTELPDDWFTILGNWDQLGRLFTNLIANAIQYTPDSGKVKVKLAHIEGLNRVDRRYSSHQLQIQVQDTGIGIPAAAIPQLFDRFYRVDPARTHTNNIQTEATGSGLGLAIASAIVDNHQGSIQLESTQNIGTTVTVTFPLDSEHPSRF